MPSTYTTNLQLARPETDDEGWGDVCNANADRLDALAPLAALAVAPAEIPSASLTVRVVPGGYPRSDGSAGWFAGATQTLPASSTRVLFLDAVGTLQAAASYPTGRHVRLAVVATGATAVTSVVDGRVSATPIGVESGSALGGLAVAPAEIPSASLNVTVAAGKYLKGDATAGSFAGATQAVPASSTRVLYLDGADALQVAASYPTSGSHVRLATATTSATAVTSVVDDRVAVVAVGSVASALALAGGTMAEGAAIEAGTATGLKLAASAGQKLGFWGASPIARPGSYTSGYATASRSMASYTPAALPASFTGLPSGQAGSPYAQVSDLNTAKAAIETLRAFAEALAQQHNALIVDLKAMGLIS